MKNIRREAGLWVQIVSVVIIWIFLLYVTQTPLQMNWEAIKKLPDVVTIYVLIQIAFETWLWRLRIFRGWLVPFPDLQGTWVG